MKVKIKSFNGKLPSYLTVGKEYEVFGFNDELDQYPLIHNDYSDVIALYINRCEHLGWGSWEVVWR